MRNLDSDAPARTRGGRGEAKRRDEAGRGGQATGSAKGGKGEGGEPTMADFRQPPLGAGAKFVRRSSAFTGIVGMAVGALMVYSQWELYRMRSAEPHPIDAVTQQNLQRTKAEREAIAHYHKQRLEADARKPTTPR